MIHVIHGRTRLSARECQHEKLTPANRQTILAIKSECWNHPEYRRGFSSTDIYAAVLDDHVSELGQFREYLKSKKGISV